MTGATPAAWCGTTPFGVVRAAASRRCGNRAFGTVRDRGFAAVRFEIGISFMAFMAFMFFMVEIRWTACC